MINVNTLFPGNKKEIVCRKINLPLSPMQIATAFWQKDGFVFLDSSSNNIQQGSHSILVWEPNLTIKIKNERISVCKNGQVIAEESDPLHALQLLLDGCRVVTEDTLPVPFWGGALGYLGFDLFPMIEDYQNLSAKDDLLLPDCIFGIYDKALVYDHFAQEWYLTGVDVFESADTLADQLEGLEIRLKNVSNIHEASGKPVKDHDLSASLKSNFEKEEYLSAVQKAIDYIYAGEIYQVNLSQRFEVTTELSAFDVFTSLRKISPSLYGVFLNYGEHQVISSSPELFVRTKGREIETRPIKGTRPRGITEEKDRELKTELQNSKKDRAELSMIVDLERNDLGRVCEFGSVQVLDHAYIEPLPTVFHTISTVVGKLREDVSVVDLLKATFPGGSITGCPKIRSIEIIDELEPTKRNVYTGSLGYIGFQNDTCLNIAIRTLICKGNRFYFQVGGGIVADSKPEDEYEETLVKAIAMIRALEASGMEND